MRITAANANLSAMCTSTLGGDDLEGANPLLQPVFHLGNTLLPTNECRSVKMAEAMVLLRDAGLCELLLSLLRRLPWAQMQHESAEREHGLALLPNLLQALCNYLGAATYVRSSQQAAACAEMSNRCVSQARLCAVGCAANLPSLKAQEHTTLSALSDLAFAKVPFLDVLQIQSPAGVRGGDPHQYAPGRSCTKHFAHFCGRRFRWLQPEIPPAGDHPITFACNSMMASQQRCSHRLKPLCFLFCRWSPTAGSAHLLHSSWGAW